MATQLVGRAAMFAARRGIATGVRSLSRGAGSKAMKLVGGYAAKYAGTKLGDAAKKAWKSMKDRRKGRQKLAKPKKINQATQSENPVSGTYLTITVPGKRIPRSIKTVGRWVYQQSHQARVTGYSGQQHLLDAFALGTPSQCVVSTGAAYNQYQNDVALVELNPYRKNTGSTYNAAAQTVKTDQFCILGHEVDLEITNFCTAQIRVEVWLIRCKKQTSLSPYTAWQQGLTETNTGLHAVAVGATPGNAVAGTVGYSQPEIMGQRPQEARKFRDYYQVINTRQVVLGAGASENILYHIRGQKRVKLEYMNQAVSESALGVAGTYFFMFCSRGQVADDITGAGHDTSYAAPIYGWVAQSKTRMCAVKGNADRLDINAVSYQISTNFTTANTDVLMPTGAVAAESANVE